MNNLYKAVLLSLFGALHCFSPLTQAVESADVVFMNGQIETLNAKQPRVNAVAIKNETFLAIVSDQKIKSYIGPNTQVIDLKQQLTVPGFVDAHTHPMETSWLKEVWVDARYPGTNSVKQALLNIAERVKATSKDQWIYVAGVSASENKFAEKRLPTKAELDQVAPNNTAIMANGAHMAIAHSAALAKMGIKKRGNKTTSWCWGTRR
ncbi:amidohydrolase family protein [Polynucleobacter necessarius]|uniref:amidohydrolase family protein n=1 Tax=Polynucleobacter necessarius TaxID=576610 RepID=UPI000E09DDAE|nr:amidohydrolase family protein [Polynucleobacter necessarius]